MNKLSDIPRRFYFTQRDIGNSITIRSDSRFYVMDYSPMNDIMYTIEVQRRNNGCDDALTDDNIYGEQLCPAIEL